MDQMIVIGLILAAIIGGVFLSPRLAIRFVVGTFAFLGALLADTVAVLFSW